MCPTRDAILMQIVRHPIAWSGPADPPPVPVDIAEQNQLIAEHQVRYWRHTVDYFRRQLPVAERALIDAEAALIRAGGSRPDDVTV